MSKKLIIIMALAAVMSFGGAFGMAWLTKPKPAAAAEPNAVQNAEKARLQAELGLGQGVGAAQSADQQEKARQRAMTEEQVRGLARDLRDKIQEYHDKLQGLEVQDQRMKEAQKGLKEDIKKLEDLRVEVAGAVASIKAQRDELERTRIRIADTEKANLKTIAATYDKMDAEGAARLLAGMCKVRNGTAADRASNVEDAVKILHYMGEKKKANVLVALMQAEPDLAGALAVRLKQIVEK
jgi:flagellar motility protein MotE (MotC chaperone)